MPVPRLLPAPPSAEWSPRRTWVRGLFASCYERKSASILLRTAGCLLALTLVGCRGYAPGYGSFAGPGYNGYPAPAYSPPPGTMQPIYPAGPGAPPSDLGMYPAPIPGGMPPGTFLSQGPPAPGPGQFQPTPVYGPGYPSAPMAPMNPGTPFGPGVPIGSVPPGAGYPVGPGYPSGPRYPSGPTPIRGGSGPTPIGSTPTTENPAEPFERDPAQPLVPDYPDSPLTPDLPNSRPPVDPNLTPAGGSPDPFPRDPEPFDRDPQPRPKPRPVPTPGPIGMGNDYEPPPTLPPSPVGSPEPFPADDGFAPEPFERDASGGTSEEVPFGDDTFQPSGPEPFSSADPFGNRGADGEPTGLFGDELSGVQPAGHSESASGSAPSMADSGTFLAAAPGASPPKTAAAPKDTPYGYDRESYRWLRGVVDFDPTDRRWHLIYSLVPDSGDPYAGDITLVGDQLGGLANNQVISVEGYLDHASPDATGKPCFRVEKLTKLRRKQ